MGNKLNLALQGNNTNRIHSYDNIHVFMAKLVLCIVAFKKDTHSLYCS